MNGNVNGKAQWNLVYYIIQQFHLEGTVGETLVTIGGVLLCMIVPYLLGSINFGLLISHRSYHDDIRSHGSGNAGTTNMLRTYGKKAAILTLVGDMLKAVVAMLFGYLVLANNIQFVDPISEETIHLNDQTGAAIAGLFVMLGHMFPCFYHFKGGKGVATSAIVVLMINPLVFLCLFAVFVIIVVGTRFVSLASMMGMILYPIFLTAFSHGANPTACALSVVMACLVVFMHRENIKRLREGKESRIALTKKDKAKAAAAKAAAEEAAALQAVSVEEETEKGPYAGIKNPNTSKKKSKRRK